MRFFEKKLVVVYFFGPPCICARAVSGCWKCPQRKRTIARRFMLLARAHYLHKLRNPSSAITVAVMLTKCVWSATMAQNSIGSPHNSLIVITPSGNHSVKDNMQPHATINVQQTGNLKRT